MAAKDLEDLEFFLSGSSIAPTNSNALPDSLEGVRTASSIAPPNAWLERSDGDFKRAQLHQNQHHPAHSTLPSSEVDDFGDFESGAQNTDTAIWGPAGDNDSWMNAPSGSHQPYVSQTQPQGSRSIEHALNNPISTNRTTASKPATALNGAGKSKPRDENILFDADDESEDDFGDFEGPQTLAEKPTKQLQVQLAPIDQRKVVIPVARRADVGSLLDLEDPDDGNDTSAWENAPALVGPQNGSQTAQEASRVHVESNVAPRKAAIMTPKALPEVTQDEDNDAWDDFEQSKPDDSARSPSESKWDDSAFTIALPPLLKPRKTYPDPPTNIPPPVLILSLFPRVFATFRNSLLDPVAHLAHGDATRDAIFASPATKEFLSSFLAISTALAHVIAGRKQRWKRDTILSQSMRIGPASSGRGGGMKLTGLDKGENTKEDREVEDVVSQWRGIVGRLKTAVTAAHLSQSVPEIAENLPVRNALQHEGPLNAPKPCIICGLKRNERINKVHAAVDDTFGEWWIEHWGHKACAEFWETYKDDLKGR